MMRFLGALLVLLCPTSATSGAPRPNIVMVIVDDWGWNSVGYHVKNGLNSDEVLTPNIDALVKTGVELDRHYVHYNGSGSRAAFQTGRMPIHVQAGSSSACNEEAGIPQNMTSIAQKMKEGGYQTHFVGKWDCGMATKRSTPHGRGYDTSLNFFSTRNWAYTADEWKGPPADAKVVPTCALPDCVKDLWNTTRPAVEFGRGGIHEEDLFRAKYLDIIDFARELGQDPLFLVYAPKLAAFPMEPPKKYQDEFSFIETPQRRLYAAVINYLDDQIGALVDKLQSAGMWDNTVMVVTADNGGYVSDTGAGCAATKQGLACFSGESGANNFPLRGGKYGTFEGGVRVNSFVTGGFLPQEVRGTKIEDAIHIADWYATFCHLAGVKPVDGEAQRAGLPAVDSQNMWDLVSGKLDAVGRDAILWDETALLYKGYKLLTGMQHVAGAATSFYPNETTPGHELSTVSLDCKEACLFDVMADPTETVDLAAAKPDMVKDLLQRMAEMSATIWKRPAPADDPECMKAARERYNGYLGPWKL